MPCTTEIKYFRTESGIAVSDLCFWLLALQLFNVLLGDITPQLSNPLTSRESSTHKTTFQPHLHSSFPVTYLGLFALLPFLFS